LETQPVVLVNQTPIVSVTTGDSQSNPVMVQSGPIVSIMQAPIISVTSPPVQVTASLPVTQRERTSSRLDMIEKHQQVWSLKKTISCNPALRRKLPWFSKIY